MYNIDSQIKFKTSMLKSGFSDYNDAYMLAKETATVPNTADAAQPVNNNDIELTFENCAIFTDWISEISTGHIDNAKNIDMVMLMYIKFNRI